MQQDEEQKRKQSRK